MYPNTMYYANVSPYGIKFPMMGGNIFFDSAKALSRKGMPYAKKIYGSINKEEIMDRASDLGSSAKQLAEENIEQLSSKAESKLAGLLGKSKAKGLSKKTKAMLKKLVKEGKKKSKKMLNKKSISQLSQLISGKGLKIMS